MGIEGASFFIILFGISILVGMKLQKIFNERGK